METPILDEEIKRLESFKNPIDEHVEQLKEYKAIKEALSIHSVSQRTYFFDCWKMNGVMDCKEIVATCEGHAILKFEKEFDDYGYDPPYV